MTVLQRTDAAPLPLVGPPGFPTAKYVERLTHPYMAANTRAGREFRFEVCRMNPLLFGLHYCRRHLGLVDPATGDTVHSFAEFHVEMAVAARRWAMRELGSGQVRDAWAWPRKSGKTTMALLVLPLWAMAYRHRRYIVVYSDTEGQAAQHLRTLKLELDDNDRLWRDFPNLCEPMRAGGRAVRSTATSYLAANDTMIEAKGMNSATLGAKFREVRPDCLLLDEIEPQESKYSLEQKNKRLLDVREGIFECNDQAVVQITGTTVCLGSIVDDLVSGRDWVGAENIRVHCTPGIVEDPLTGEERSCWPQRWSLEELRGKRARNPRSWAKNYENRPVSADGTFWRPEHITYATLERELTDRVMVVDPAAKSSKKNDETGIALLGYARDLGRVVVENVAGVRLQPDQLRQRVHATCRIYGVRTILCDVTNGGDWVLNGLEPTPPGVRIVPVQISGRSKLDRITELHDRYLRVPPRVVHAKPLTALEAQMFGYPNVLTDDLIDSVALGAQYLLDGPAKVGR